VGHREQATFTPSVTQGWNGVFSRQDDGVSVTGTSSTGERHAVSEASRTP
jgi:hypothetical protein